MAELSTDNIKVPLHTMECASHCQLVDYQKRQYEKARLNVIRARMAETEMEYRTREMIDGALYLLQAPLNVIQAMSNNMERQTCQQKVLHCAPMGCAVEEALESGEAAKNRLSLAIPEKKSMVHGPINVNEAIRDCLVIMADQLAAAGIVVDWRAQPDLAMTFGDEIGLRVLLRILIDNAIIAVAQDNARAREVGVTSRTADDGLIEVCIHDTGSGIDRGLRSKVFEPFFTAWSEGPHRSGMGLAIAHQILSDLHGEIEIRDGGGIGTFVSFTLPAC
ncbi:nitrogen fixation negative regulator NifL [Cohaesibacter sp. ES.047]|uniref:ATP-binding protein n=1 Tax=Cohaesibacter sp. ES.047 TaxID=1798205 RepID=UPI000BB8D55B|nr:ATP-binding protein [Cohaesibacter sp. ES.047]SNY92907.1 nitrogen fixation negative regulator NifL [Cohaesibacter sp. ES.047]